MVVYDFDILRSLYIPPEYDSPLIVYPDRMPADEVSSQGFKTVPWGRREVTKHCGVVQLYQFSARDLGNIYRKPLWNASLSENQCRERAPEASDHRPIVS